MTANLLPIDTGARTDDVGRRYFDDPAQRPCVEDVVERLIAAPGRRERAVHVETVPARLATTGAWPRWLDPAVVAAYRHRGVDLPWMHQIAVAELAHAGHHVVVATGTASGKSLAYHLPVLHAVLASDQRPATALYLSPTKALAADQLRCLHDLDLPGVRAATFDGDTPYDERAWIRAHANVVLANPDVVHRSMLPGHRQWSGFLRGLRYVVIDECHSYRGVFGSHVAQVLRRLRRVAAHYGAQPVFVLASATVSEPAASAGRLTGVEVSAVTEDASPKGATRFVLWEPPLIEGVGRRSVVTETADLLADLVIDNVRTVAFVRSRRGAEAVALATKRMLSEVDGISDFDDTYQTHNTGDTGDTGDTGFGPDGLARRVAAYRSGYLPEERRALEHALRGGYLLGLATTSALELGVDVSGLDAVLLAGFPGTRASMWQQAGRAGRGGGESLAVLVARDDPLDTYLVHHPEALFGNPVETTVLDPDNSYVLAPHLCAAASEVPLRDDDVASFGPNAPATLANLAADGLLRRRPDGWYWPHRERASDLADIRGTGGAPIDIIDELTGQLLGTANAGSAHMSVHAGAVYVHQGSTYVVSRLEEDDFAALVRRAEVDYFTTAREVTDIHLVETLQHQRWAEADVCFGSVDVTTQVVSYLRRRVSSGEVLAEIPLDLPARQLTTRAVWWTLPDALLADAGLVTADVPGAAHAAEHASIGLLPLFATCDRWDIGGVSTARHADTGCLTVVVYDGHAGGAGFAERGYEAAAAWLTATREAIAACTCDGGCPSCVQSPKCGNGNEPLDKAAAVRLLDALLAQAHPRAFNAPRQARSQAVIPAPPGLVR